MREYKIIYYKKSITGLFGVGDGIIEEFDNVLDAYRRFIQLKNGKKKYLINIYRLDIKIDEPTLLNDWSEEIEKPYKKSLKKLKGAKDKLNQNIDKKKTFKKELNKDGDNPEKEFARVYSSELVFGVYITKDYHLGIHDVNIINLLHLLDTNREFNLAFRMLTGLVENKTPFKSEVALANAIEGIFQPLKNSSSRIEVLILP